MEYSVFPIEDVLNNVTTQRYGDMFLVRLQNRSMAKDSTRLEPLRAFTAACSSRFVRRGNLTHDIDHIRGAHLQRLFNADELNYTLSNTPSIM